MTPPLLPIKIRRDMDYDTLPFIVDHHNNCSFASDDGTHTMFTVKLVQNKFTMHVF